MLFASRKGPSKEKDTCQRKQNLREKNGFKENIFERRLPYFHRRAGHHGRNMMRGPERTAVAIRLPNGKIYMRTQPNPKGSKWGKIPLVRGVVNFVASLVYGTKTLMYSADVLEQYYPEEYEKDKFDIWVEEKFGKEKAWKILMVFSVLLAIVMSVAIFMLLPTVAVGWMSHLTGNIILLNLVEGIVRIAIFMAYIVLIAQMKDIKTVFQYHGAEHKTIHCFENGLELTPANAQQFYTLHPRCGTSFLVFVMIIAIFVHALMGWPNVAIRVISRILVLRLSQAFLMSCLSGPDEAIISL